APIPTAPIPIGTALPSVGTEAIYSAETVSVTPRTGTKNTEIEAKTKAPAPPAQRRAERERRSTRRRRLPILVVLLLIAAGGLSYRAKHQKQRAAEIPPPPSPPAVSTQAEQANKTAEKADQSQKSDESEKSSQPGKSDQTADAIQTLINDQLRKAGINPQNPSDVSGLVGSHPNNSTKSSSGAH